MSAPPRLYPEEAELVPSWSQKSLGMEGMNKTAPTEVVGYILHAGQNANTEILASSVLPQYLQQAEGGYYGKYEKPS